MTAAAFISGRTAMILPYRITQIQIARIGRGTNHGTTHRTRGSTQSGITRSSTDRGTARGAQHGTAHRAVTRIGAATGDKQGRRKTQNHRRAHIWLPIFCGHGNARREDGVPFIRLHGKILIFGGLALPRTKAAIVHYCGKKAARPFPTEEFQLQKHPLAQGKRVLKQSREGTG